MSAITLFQSDIPSVESFWRSVILFGVNIASYKFALAQALLQLSKRGSCIISLNDLAIPYASHICQHLRSASKQTTGKTPPFIQACNLFNSGDISQDDLSDVTLKHGYRYVLDAFHVENRSSIPIKFFHKDFHGNQKKSFYLALLQ